jgi:hypothetical protein
MTRTTLTRLTTLSRHIAHRLQWTTTGTGSCCASDGMNGKTKVKPRALLATLSPALRVAFALTIVLTVVLAGVANAQTGKNHLGDRNEYLPTLHGFDEFYGNLYHLNAQEEPEDPDRTRSS